MGKIFSLLLITSLLIACNSKDQPVSRDEALHFAKKLEFAIKKKRTGEFDSVFNYDVFGKRIAREGDMDVSTSFIRGIKLSIRKKLDELWLGDAGNYEFIRNYEKDGKQHVIFRFFGEKGLNYHDMELIKMNGLVRVADMFILLSGENLSKTMGSLMGSLQQYMKNTSEGQAENFMASITKMRSLIVKNRYEEAKALYDGLPPHFKKERAVAIYNIQISSELSEDAYLEAIEEFEQSFAGDASSQLALLDAYIMKKDYPKALRALEVVDSSVKRDPLLNYHRALIYSKMEDQENCIKYLEILRKEKPGFEDGLLELIATYVQLNEKAKAKEIVAEYRSNNTLNQQKLENVLYMYPVNDRAGK